MGWSVDSDLAAHRRAVETFLAADPVGVTGQASLLLNLVAGVRWSDDPPRFAVHRGTGCHEHRRLHLLALPGPEALRPPPATTGTARAATPADLPRLLELHRAMRAEIGETGPMPQQVLVDRVVAGLLWVVDGEDGPVATANATVAAAGVSRVAGVHTEPTHRGRGLAAVVTAAVTRAAYGAGAAHVCLFTDAANPTSNGVYERLGYRRRPTDRVVLRFG